MTPPAQPPATRWGWRLVSSLTVGLGLAAILLTGVPIVRMLIGVIWHDSGFTLEALHEAFHNGEQLVSLLINSLSVVVGTLVVSIALGAPLGFLCFRTDLPGRHLAISGAIVAACVPLYVTTAGWMAWLGAAFWQTNGTLPGKIAGVCWIQGIAYVPLVMLISGVAFSQADPEQEELARLDGGPVAVWVRVILPQAAWALAAASLAILVLCFADITVTDLLVVRTFPEEAFIQFQTSPKPWAGTASTLPLMAILLVICLILWKQLQHHGQQTRERPPPRLRLHLLWKALGLSWLLLITGLVVIPIVKLILAVQDLTYLRTGIAGVADEVILTAWIVPVTAIVSTVLGAGWAWWLVRRPRHRWLSGGLLLLLLATPAPVLGVGLITCFNQPGLLGMVYDSPMILVLAMMLRALPLTALAIVPSIRAVPCDLEQAAALEGATWLEQLLRITFPLSWRGLVLGWSLAMILALGELGASVLVAPPGATTVTVRFFTLIHNGLYPDAASMCVLVLAVIIVPGMILATLLSSQLRRRYD